MAFPTALLSDQVDYLSTMQFASDCYLIVWGQNVVYAAQNNNISGADTFSQLSHFNATKGVYTDAKEGYTVWLSPTTDIRDALWWGRLREDATAGLMEVEWNSFFPVDNYYIFVTKDVRESTKTPRKDGSSWLADYDISYHAPRPIIYGIPTFFLAVIDADGNADITINPNAYPIAAGATISSWALDTDGGTQQSFNGATGDAVIRFTAPGNYMPRLTVTDSNGIAQWFTPFVAVVPADLSTVVNLNFEDIDISANVNNGWNMTMPFWDGVQNVLDGSMCAVYMPHKTAGNKLLFCGRIRTEGSDYTADGSGEVSFNAEGLASVMNNLSTISWRHKDIAAPDDFAEITTLTPWRSVGAYIATLTNINNTHSLVLDDVTDDYQYLSYFYQKGTLLDSLRDQMWSINMDFDFSSDGMFRLVRNMRYQTEAERDALVNVANFEFKHFSGDSADDAMYSLELDHSSQVGRAINGCGWYNTTSKTVTPFASLSPPVQPSRGTEQVVTDRQVLKANLSRTDAETEGKRRVRNNFAAAQQLDTLSGIQLSGGFTGKFNPSVSDYYTFSITVADGIRLLVYTSSDRWLLTDLVLAYDNETGQVGYDPTFQIESDDLGFTISIRDPLPATPYNVPVQLPLPAVPTFPSNPDIDFPTGATDGDEQPVDEEDVEDVEAAQDPSTTYTYNETTLMIWNGTECQMTNNFGSPNPDWFDITPGGVSGTLQQGAWSRDEASGEGAYLISNNGDINDPETIVYHSKSPRGLANWQDTTLTDMLATMVNTAGGDTVIVYGKFKTAAPPGGFPISALFEGEHSGKEMTLFEEDDLVPSTHAGHTSSLDMPGIYTELTPGFFGYVGQTVPGPDPGRGHACNIKVAIPPGITITTVTCRIRQFYNGGPIVGEDDNTIILDDTQLVFYTFPNADQTITISGTPGLPSPAVGDTLYFHTSTDRGTGSDVWITGVNINGTIDTDFSGTRYSTDLGENFDPAKSVGKMELGDGSMTRRKGQGTLASKDERVKLAPLAGLGFVFNADQGSTPGQYAVAMLETGKDDYVFATDDTLYKVLDDVRTDITPNDGANDGVVIGIGSIAMSSASDDHLWFLADFAGTVKLAYTINLSDATPTWNFTEGFSNAANWVSVNPRSLSVVYVADSQSVWRSIDGGDSVVQYQAPIGTLVGVEPL